MTTPPDWLINNAGFAVPGRFAELPLERTLPMIELHVLAAARFSRAVLPEMIDRGTGRIVNVASIGAFLPRPGDAIYCATKAYLVNFSRALQGELAGTGVQVQALCPGFTRTEFYDRPDYASYPVGDYIPRRWWMTSPTMVDVGRRRGLGVPQGLPATTRRLRSGRLESSPGRPRTGGPGRRACPGA